MYVHSVLLHRKGIGGFDPVSDGFLIFNGEPSEAVYYTWRKYNQPIPNSCTLAGVFLGDHYGNFTFEGIRNSGSLGYVRTILPKLKEGYQHSEYHGLFEEPHSKAELVHKIACLNHLYFGVEDFEIATPTWVRDKEFSWMLIRETGVTKLRCPSNPHFRELGPRFYEVVKEVNPSRYHDDPRIRPAT